VGALKRLTKNIALALDADAAGEEAMLRSVSYENILGAEVKVIILPGGKDPDNVIKEDVKLWQQLVEGALPVIDYTFNIVTAELDLTTAKDKSSAVEKLLPIIAEIKDAVRQAHYLQKLARLVKVNEHSLEAALGRIKPSQTRRPIKEPKPEAVTHALHPLLSSPVEEYCLALLLQHPGLKARHEGPLPEYFENSENHEIFIAWQQADNLSSLKDKVDSAIWEHLDSLINKSLPTNQIEQRFADCVLNLRKEYLRNLEAKKAEVLALEAEMGGTAAELAKLEEQGIEVSVQLGKIFTEKGQSRSDVKR